MQRKKMKPDEFKYKKYTSQMSADTSTLKSQNVCSWGQILLQFDLT